MNILILALSIVVLVAGVRWFLARAPKHGKRFLLQLLLIILALLTLWLALTGRLHWLFALFSSLLPFARRLLPVLLPLLRWLPWLKQQRRRQQAGRQRSGQRSTVRSRQLEMTLDHDSGDIDGQVLEGTLAGRLLSQLSDSELLDFYQLCLSQDPEAIRLLDSYIERHRPNLADQPSPESDQPSPEGPNELSREQAYQILGLTPGASESDIVQAHKRMMQKLHPDRGGSNYLAAMINQAKQRLLQD